jgi:hypothetical protein
VKWTLAIPSLLVIIDEPIDSGKGGLVLKNFIRLHYLLNIYVVAMGPFEFHLSAIIIHHHTFKRY